MRGLTIMNDKPKMKKAGGYLFLPRAWQKQEILIWLRRTHAWTGIYGAIFFFCLGLTGFYLNHRTAILHIDGGVTHEVAQVNLSVEPDRITDEASLEAWMREALNATGEVFRGRRPAPGGQVQFRGQDMEQPQTLSLSLRGPNAVLSAEYVVGSNMVAVEQTSPSLLKALIDLHKVVGVGAMFILIMDTMAGAMVFMSVSGVLLWTRLHGPRLAAVAIMGGVVVLTAAALSQVWVSWSA